ncbi:MAG: ABC transporter substrate-binding protein [Actinomycetota bacterium]|nr:ABC transporter substrate-binding protein [Actinomycetota bacterium]
MRRTVTGFIALATLLVACGDDDDESGSDSVATGAPSAPTAAGATAPADGDDTATTGDGSAAIEAAPVDEEAAACADGKTLADGMLTVATGEPAFPPYVLDDAPESGQGFEAAVAYAVATTMGFTPGQVTWTRTAFDAAIAPGPKDFDFNLQQFGIQPERAEVVSFSDSYYTTNQAILGFADSPAATATDIVMLQELQLGVVEGTTGLDFVEEVLQPASAPNVYSDTAAAKQALDTRQIDAIVVDLPTAFFMSAVEIEGSQVYGQFPTVAGMDGESWGLLFTKDNPLVECANLALAALTDSGQLEALTTTWMSDSVGVPEISLE